MINSKCRCSTCQIHKHTKRIAAKRITKNDAAIE